jgi:hypothetical protein
MRPWPRHPLLLEVNAWVWLNELSQKQGSTVELSTVPEPEWDAIAAQGFDAVWLMGVWERSPAGIAISLHNPGLLGDFERALPDVAPRDNVGSPYCVRRYVVDAHLGGPEGLASARRQLAQRGLRLILDFVSNHVAPDHPWVKSHPEYFVQGSPDDARSAPSSFHTVGDTVFALGRDPGFPAWPDVLQLNAFHPGLRQTALATLSELASQCDGVRCDMAMLQLNGIFARTWGTRVGAKPGNDYWEALIPAIRSQHPEFRFIAEAYWDLEWVLQQQGFDFCYDKQLYDRMAYGSAESVRQHLQAELSYQQGLIRFIENHDEARAALVFPNEKARAAAVVMLTLPGARLLHEGQSQARRVRLPVFLGRRPTEPVDAELAAFYARLLQATERRLFRDGEWRLCERSGWPDNPSFENVLAWCWVQGEERALVVVNFGPAPAQARVLLSWDELCAHTWRLDDVLSGDTYDRDGSELKERGLYVELGPWQYHLFELRAGR